MIAAVQRETLELDRLGSRLDALMVPGMNVLTYIAKSYEEFAKEVNAAYLAFQFLERLRRSELRCEAAEQLVLQTAEQILQDLRELSKSIREDFKNDFSKVFNEVAKDLREVRVEPQPLDLLKQPIASSAFDHARATSRERLAKVESDLPEIRDLLKDAVPRALDDMNSSLGRLLKEHKDPRKVAELSELTKRRIVRIESFGKCSERSIASELIVHLKNFGDPAKMAMSLRQSVEPWAMAHVREIVEAVDAAVVGQVERAEFWELL